jgi:hypothetical protein
MLLMTAGALRGGQILRNRHQQAAKRGSRFINFANFGILDPACLAFETLSIKHVSGGGPIQHGPGLPIALSTNQNTLHLVAQRKGDAQFRRFTRDSLEAILGQFR